MENYFFPLFLSFFGFLTSFLYALFPLPIKFFDYIDNLIDFVFAIEMRDGKQSEERKESGEREHRDGDITAKFGN